MDKVKMWMSLTAVFFVIAAFMTAYSLGWLGPVNMVYAGSNGLAGAPPASNGLVNLNPKTVIITSGAVVTPTANMDDTNRGKLCEQQMYYRNYGSERECNARCTWDASAYCTSRGGPGCLNGENNPCIGTQCSVRCGWFGGNNAQPW